MKSFEKGQKLGWKFSLNVKHLSGPEGLSLVGDTKDLTAKPYRIYPGDDLDIKFYLTPQLSDAAKVRPDGMITMQLVGDVKAAGKTPSELTDDLLNLYKPHLTDPEIAVIVRSFTGHRAYVGGEVAIPQTIPLSGGISALQAIYRTGGNLYTGDMERVLLIRKSQAPLPVTYVLDLSDESLANNKPDSQVALMDSDILFIPRTGIAKANLFVQQYIRNLLLFNGTNVGASYLYIKSHDETDYSDYGFTGVGP